MFIDAATEQYKDGQSAQLELLHRVVEFFEAMRFVVVNHCFQNNQENFTLILKSNTPVRVFYTTAIVRCKCKASSESKR